uniref:Uncharacterized protein n=1 Tax=Micrurus lemniscatus lemniscatus TaxID=129467 RepID=A0A2D4HMN0_MICLE
MNSASVIDMSQLSIMSEPCQSCSQGGMLAATALSMEKKGSSVPIFSPNLARTLNGTVVSGGLPVCDWALLPYPNEASSVLRKKPIVKKTPARGEWSKDKGQG